MSYARDCDKDAGPTTNVPDGEGSQVGSVDATPASAPASSDLYHDNMRSSRAFTSSSTVPPLAVAARCSLSCRRHQLGKCAAREWGEQQRTQPAPVLAALTPYVDAEPLVGRSACDALVEAPQRLLGCAAHKSARSLRLLPYHQHVLFRLGLQRLPLVERHKRGEQALRMSQLAL